AVVFKQIPADEWGAGRTLTDIVIAVDKDACAAWIVDDRVICEIKAIVTLGPIQENNLRATGDVRSVHHVLVDRDVGSSPIHPNGLRRVGREDVMDMLHPVLRS